MIREVLNRAFVLDQLRQVRRHLEAEAEEDRRSGDELPAVDDQLDDTDYQDALEAARAAEAREDAETSGQPAFDRPDDDRRGDETDSLDDHAFFSRDPVVSNLQSALEEYFEDRESDNVATLEDEDDGRRSDAPAEVAVTDRHLRDVDSEVDADGRRVFEKFSKTDVGWVTSVFAWGIRRLRDRHPFVDRPATPFEIADRCRVLMVGDWGSGVPRAIDVAAQMRREIDGARTAGVPVHVVHLGDVYYSGWKREYEKRFLQHWPVAENEADRISSWSTNANHDMYAGGHAYYKTLLADPRFAGQEGSSFFSLFNRHWRLLGIDTGWKEKDLEEPQPAWIDEQCADARARGQKTILMSHHQLFSAEEEASPALAENLRGPLERDEIHGWFWGHEHRCQLFERRDGVPFARLVGHGGVPVWQWRDEHAPLPATVRHEYRGRFKQGAEWWARFGFAALDFDGPKIEARYIDELGAEHHRETIE